MEESAIGLPNIFERNVQKICRHIFQIYEFPGKFWYRRHFYMAYLSQRRRPNSPIVRGSSPAQVGSKKIGRPGFHSRHDFNGGESAAGFRSCPTCPVPIACVMKLKGNESMKRFFATTAVITVLAGAAVAGGAFAQTAAPSAIQMQAPPQSQAPTRTIRERLPPARIALPRRKRNPASRKLATPTFPA